MAPQEGVVEGEIGLQQIVSVGQIPQGDVIGGGDGSDDSTVAVTVEGGGGRVRDTIEVVNVKLLANLNGPFSK